MEGDKGGVNLGSCIKKTLEKINFKFCPTSKVQELQCYHKSRKNIFLNLMAKKHMCICRQHVHIHVRKHHSMIFNTTHNHSYCT